MNLCNGRDSEEIAKSNVLLRLTKDAGSDWQQLLKRELTLAPHKEAQRIAVVCTSGYISWVGQQLQSL